MSCDDFKSVGSSSEEFSKENNDLIEENEITTVTYKD